MGRIIRPPEEVLAKLRPHHIDFDVMRSIVIEMDDSEDAIAHLEQISGSSIEEIMNYALAECIELTRAKDDPHLTSLLIMNMGSVSDYIDYYSAAWVAGLARSLQETRGMDIPEAYHLTFSTFWDIDTPSLMWVVNQRTLRAMYDPDGGPKEDPSHPLVIMSSLFIDGLAVGYQFDAFKEKMLN